MKSLSAYDAMLEDQGLLIREGDKVGYSIVLLCVAPSKYKRFILRCRCGKVFMAFASNVVNQRTKGCGCSRGKGRKK